MGQDLADRLPPDVGKLRILRSDELELAQTIAKLVRGLALVTSLLALGLFALAIYLSRGYRWITVLGVGVGLIVAGILVLILRELAGGVVVDQLASRERRAGRRRHLVDRHLAARLDCPQRDRLRDLLRDRRLARVAASQLGCDAAGADADAARLSGLGRERSSASSP